MKLSFILILCNLTTFVLTVFTIIHTSRLRRLRSIRWLIALSVTFLIGSFSLVNLYASETLEQKKFFLEMRVWGMAFLTPCWLYFMSSVFGIWNWLHRKWVTVLMFLPSFLNLFLIVNPSTRDLLFTNFQPISYLGVDSARFDFGSWYIWFFQWAMIQMLMSYVISIIAFVKNRRHKRWQVFILNLGLTVSLVQSIVAHIYSNALELEFIVTNTFPLLGTAVGILFAVVYHRLLSIVPLATVKIFDQLPDPIFVLDDENRLMAASAKAKDFFGLRADFLGERFDLLVPSVPLTPGEVTLQDREKSWHHFHIALESIDQSGEASSGTIVFLRDISQQKNSEFRLMEGMEKRTRLLAMMAHDLSGFVDTQSMIARSMQNNLGSHHSQQFDHLETLSMASQNLISNVMAWAQNESQTFDLVKKSFEWNSLIGEVLEQLQERLAVKGIAVEFAHSSPILCTGDSEMMSSVFRNILLNSIRATPSGKKIFVTLTESGSHVEVRIRDEGQGIAPDELKRILEASKAFSLEGISKSHGSGIGLMLARYFLSLHGGSFSLESESGAGTVAVFSVPL